MDIDQFTGEHGPTETAAPFRLENPYTLDITVDESLLAKAGAMVAYTGGLSFTGRASAEGGLTGLIKEAATNEGTPVMEIEGSGHVYLADHGKKVQVLNLEANETVTINGEDILAFDSGVTYEIGSIDSLTGSLAGGFTNVYLEGPGHVAFTTYGDPIVLTPPVMTDPRATVAWSGTTPDVSINANLSDMVGQESGERYQMEFGGDGFVVVQPQEEHA